MKDLDIQNCQDALRVLAEHLDRQLFEHLDSCRSCYSRSEFDRQLKAQIRQLGHEPVPAAVVDRVHGLLREFALPPIA